MCLSHLNVAIGNAVCCMPWFQELFCFYIGVSSVLHQQLCLDSRTEVHFSVIHYFAFKTSLWMYHL